MQALRTEVDSLEARAEALEAELKSVEAEQRRTLAARESALRAELLSLQGQMTALLSALERSRPPKAAGTKDATVLAEADADGGASANADAGRARPSRRKPATEEEPAPEPMEDPAERVRALMADVAARLQVASESVEQTKQTAARLGRARQLLVEADRAASKKKFDEAETLAQDAAEVIADTLAQAGTAEP